MWRETASSLVNGLVKVFQSTPSVWRETYCPSSSGDSDHGFQSTPSVWRETGRLSGGMTDVSDFNPLPPCGGRRFRRSSSTPCSVFQSTPSVWRETGSGATYDYDAAISIHSLRVEGDHAAGFCGYCIFYFNPLPPRGGRQLLFPRLICDSVFQSTPSVWRETTPPSSGSSYSLISIHSLRVEGDMPAGMMAGSASYFNPLPPCGGRLRISHLPQRQGHFNPLPPCGGRPRGSEKERRQRAPFQSTPSVWRETLDSRPDRVLITISIHSLRVEGDPTTSKRLHHDALFQSTPSVWRETTIDGREWHGKSISIHSLRVEGDPRTDHQLTIPMAFQSTPSVWRETYATASFQRYTIISIHSLRVEGDPSLYTCTKTMEDFNPLPPCGGRPKSQEVTMATRKFQSTPSVWRETSKITQLSA